MAGCRDAIRALRRHRRAGDAAAQLDALLLATARGLLLAQPPVAARTGSAPITRASALALGAVLALPALAPTPLTLAAALAALGACNGALDGRPWRLARERLGRRPLAIARAARRRAWQ